MNNVIRWPGLVAFIVISALIALITFGFLNTWIKIASVSALEDATGAEVNIDSVEHSFSPFGVTFHQVQLTDPAKPTHNQLQAGKIHADVQLSPLLLRKVIIDKLDITEAQFAVERQSEGAVYRVPESEDAGIPGFTGPDAIPDVDELLANSPLKTTKAIEDVNQAYQRHSESLQNQYQSLPTKDKLDEYKARLKALSEVDYKDPQQLAKAKEDFDKIKEDLKKDKQKFSDFKQAVSDAKSDVSPKLAALKAAPGQDYDLLKGAIAGDAGALNEVTKMVFGEKADEWSNYVLSAYNIVAPMLNKSSEQQQQQQRIDGRWVAFDDKSGLPDIWIKQANVSVKWQNESINSVWQNITHQHALIGKPTTYMAKAEASSLWQSFELDGNFEISDAGVNALQNWAIQGVKLAEQELLASEDLTSRLLSALVSSSGKLTVENSMLKGDGMIDLSQLKMAADGQTNLTQVVAEALTGLSSLKIDTLLSGTFDKPDFAFSSNLDSQLASAVLSNLTGDQQSKLGELQQKLNAKTSGALGTDTELSQWIEWESLADGNMGSIDEMLKSQFTNVLDKEKDKLKDKLLNKLFKKN